jgi:hypothetical protein
MTRAHSQHWLQWGVMESGKTQRRVLRNDLPSFKRVVTLSFLYRANRHCHCGLNLVDVVLAELHHLSAFRNQNHIVPVNKYVSGQRVSPFMRRADNRTLDGKLLGSMVKRDCHTHTHTHTHIHTHTRTGRQADTQNKQTYADRQTYPCKNRTKPMSPYALIEFSTNRFSPDPASIIKRSS